MSSLPLLLLCLAAPSAQPDPVGVVVIARAMGLEEAQLTATAGHIGAAFERAGGAMVPAPKLKESKECRGAQACLCELARLKSATVVLSVELAALRESVAVRLDAHDARTEKRLARREIATNREALKSGFLPGLEDFAKSAVEAARAAGAVPERPPAPPIASQTPAAPPPAPAPALAENRPAVEKAADPGNGRRIAGYTIGGVGLAVLAGGVVAGVLAQGAYDEAEGLKTSPDQAKFEAARSDARTLIMLADVLYGVGAVALGTGLYLTLTSPSSPTSVSVGPAAGAPGVMAFGSF